jgi:hypothetical protein
MSARTLALAHFDPPAKRDQRRREIADRRAVGDVAADGAGLAHLGRAEARHHDAEIGVQRRQMRRRARERRGRAEAQAVGGLLDRAEPGDAAEPDDLL